MAENTQHSLEYQMRTPYMERLGYDTVEGKEVSGRNLQGVDEALLSLRLLQQYEPLHLQWEDQFEQAKQFRSGAQWTEKQENELKRRGMSPIVINRMRPIIETAIALLTYNTPQFRSTGREDSDRATGRLFADLFSHVWYISGGNTELKQAIDDYYVGGMGVLGAIQDPNADMGKGEVFIKAFDPRMVYWDMNTKDTFGRDASNVLVTRVLTDEQSERLWPEFFDRIKSSSQTYMEDRSTSTGLAKLRSEIFGESITDTYHIRRRYIERYTKVVLTYYHVFEKDAVKEHILDEDGYKKYRNETAVVVMTANGDRTVVTERKAVAELEELIAATGGVYHLAPAPPMMNPATGQPEEAPPLMIAGEETGNAIPGSTTYLIPTSKGKLVDENDILVNELKQNRIKMIFSVGNDVFLYKRILPCEDYPIVSIMSIHNRNPFPESDVRMYRGQQEYINKLNSLVIAHTTNATNVKVFVPQGVIDKKTMERNFAKAGAAFIEYNAEYGVPVVAAPIPLPNELYKNISDAKYDMEYGFGIHEIMQGSTQGMPSNQPYRGTLLVDEFGQRRIKSKRDDVESALNQLGKVCIPLMQQIYTEEKVVRIAQPNNLSRTSKFNIPVYDEYTREEIGRVHDITTGRYDLVVVSGSTLPSDRFGKLDVYMAMYEKGLIDQLEVLKKTDIVDAEGVLARFSLIKQLQTELGMAQEEIKRLKGDLQTAEREEVHAKKRLAVKDFETDLDKAGNKVDMATLLYQERIKDDLAKVRSMVKPLTAEGRS